MSVGVEVDVVDGVATVAFTNIAERGVGIAALLKAAGDPSLVRKVTRPRGAYVVPVGVAERAFSADFGLDPVDEVKDKPVRKAAAASKKPAAKAKADSSVS